MNLVEYELMMNLLIPFVMVTVVFSWLLLLTFFGSDTFAAIDKRFANYISGVGKGISSGKIAPIPKTRPVRRPKENK